MRNPEQPKYKVFADNGRVVYRNCKTVVRTAYLGQDSASRPTDVIPVVVKMPKAFTLGMDESDYLKAISDLYREASFYRDLAWACPHIVKGFSEELLDGPNQATESSEEANLIVERILPLSEILNFIKAKGLPDLLSVAHGMYGCVKFVHHHQLAHCDIKPDNFGIDYETENSSHPDGMLNAAAVKGMDFGTLREVKIRQSNDFPGTPSYVPLYRLRMEICNRGLIKADIMALALSYYDLFTNCKRLKHNAKPAEMTHNQWLWQTVERNHTIRFKAEDLLFLFPPIETGQDLTSSEQFQQAHLLAIKLNTTVMKNALNQNVYEGYQSVDQFYTDFVCSFEELLTEAQLARLLGG